MYRFVFLFLAAPFFLINSSLAQNTDSLLRVANSNSPDSIKAKALYQLASKYYYDSPDSSIIFYSRCLSLTRNAGDELLRYKALSDLSFLYAEKSNYSKSKDC